MPIFDVHTYLGGSAIPGVAHNAAAIAATMQARGVQGAVLLSAHARQVDPLSGNRILKAMTDQSPNLYACLITHINRVATSIEAMRGLMSGRKFVAMAIVGESTGEPVHRSVADEILNAYRRYTKPLFLFTPNGAATRAALEIAQAYPMLKVVFLGMGGQEWREAVIAAHLATNVYLETSGPMDRAKIPAAVETIGANRILFGSSSPHVDVAAAVGLLEDSDINEETRRRIFYDNARRLFELES